MTKSPRCWVLAVHAWLLIWPNVGRAAQATGSGSRSVSPDPAIDDATLRSVYFADAKQGWVAGDRGAIWRTVDGGAHWELQSSGTVCALRSVYFATPKQGWIVGGQALPHVPLSAGLVLATEDGGEHWWPLSWQQMPRLYGVRFPDARVGWAWGESSPMFGSGLFTGESGGRRWLPVRVAGNSGWLAGDLVARGHGALAGAGTLAAMIGGSVRPLANQLPAGASIRAMALSESGTGWAVGDGGIILQTASLGDHWRAVTLPLPAEYRALFDWHGVSAQGNAVWIVGRPGSVVLHSPDAGQTWSLLPTGQNTPLQAVWFHDARLGWAVGALGTILHTADAGRTWQVQRNGGTRAAVLAVHGRADRAPLLATTKLAGDLAYLTADLALIAPHPAHDSLPPHAIEARLADAIAVAGGSHVELDWRFPNQPSAASPTELLAHWDREREGRAAQDLERRLALAIRLWRPAVVLFDDTWDLHAPGAQGELLAPVVQRAFESAANAAAFPELRDLARLEPWSAQKLYVQVSGRDRGAVVVDAEELRHSDGQPLAESNALATSLLHDRQAPPARLASYRLVASRLKRATDTAFQDGIALEAGGPARRRLQPPGVAADGDAPSPHRRAAQALLARAETDPAAAELMKAELGRLLATLSADRAGHLLCGLARAQYRQGRWDTACELYEKLARDYATHIAAIEANRWLVQFYASSEARHRIACSGFATEMLLTPRKAASVTAAAGDTVATVQVAESPVAPSAGGKVEVDGRSAGLFDTASRAMAVGELGSAIPWANGATNAADRLGKLSRLLWSDPAVQFPLAAAQRQQGKFKEADQFYTAFALGRAAAGDAWGAAAAGERWLRDRFALPPKPVLVVRGTSVRPHLDGRLDEPLWKAAGLTALATVAGDPRSEWGSELRMTYDAEYLYVGVRCTRPARTPAGSPRPRPRDPDLHAFDRVEWFLDLDRDFATYYRLCVDERGWVAEDCWGDRSWNPTWYVASHAAEGEYTIEAALPLQALTASPPKDGTVWAFNAVRVVPGGPIQAVAQPASAEPRPEGFGYLMFADAVLQRARSAVAN
jgi:photosystem II stability/assembly factor-like uncharacterized protein/tetratricopeptide (TPR) repeat protein